MARSTSLIAIIGAVVLAVAVGAIALRGTDDGEPGAAPSPSDTAAESPSETESPFVPTPSDSDTSSPTATDTASPDDTFIPTAPEADGSDGDGTSGGDTGTNGGDTGTSDGSTGDGGDTSAVEDDTRDGADDDGDDTLALGPDGIQDTPNTGGGALTALGAAVAAGAVAAGRRQRG